MSVAVANLTKSHEFLKKLLDVCGKLTGAPSTSSDREMLIALAHLTKLTETILYAAKQAQRDASNFSAHRTLGERAPTTELSFGENEAVRLRIILELCLEQGERHRQRAAALRNERAAVQRELRSIEQDLLVVRAALMGLAPGNPEKKI